MNLYTKMRRLDLQKSYQKCGRYLRFSAWKSVVENFAIALIKQKCASQFCREPENKNKNVRNLNIAYLIRQSFQGHRCKSGIVISFHEGSLEVTLPVPFSFLVYNPPPPITYLCFLYRTRYTIHHSISQRWQPTIIHIIDAWSDILKDKTL